MEPRFPPFGYVGALLLGGVRGLFFARDLVAIEEAPERAVAGGDDWRSRKPGRAGAGVSFAARTRLQSSPSSSDENCAADNRITPYSIFGQRNCKPTLWAAGAVRRGYAASAGTSSFFRQFHGSSSSSRCAG